MFDFVDICRNAQTITISIVYSSENVKLPDGAYILGGLYNKSWFCCLSHVSLSAFKKHKQQQFSSLKGHFFKAGDVLDTGSIPGKPETFSK